MYHIKTIFLFLIFLTSSLFAQEVIKPVYLPGDIVDINSSSKAWLSAKNESAYLYSADTNISKSKKIDFKSLYTNSVIALLVKIPVEKSFAFFIEFPSEDNATSLPYVDEGDQNGSVVVAGISKSIKKVENFCEDNCTQENNETIFFKQSTITQEKIVYKGYISKGVKKSPLDKKSSLVKIGYENDYLYIVKKIKNLSATLHFAFLFKTKDNNESIKYLSKWIEFGFKKSEEFENKNILTDNCNIKRGRELFIQNCVACHRYDKDATARKGIAPVLTNIGGWGNEEFIKESLLYPNKMINPKFAKSIKEGKIMPMPSFEWLEKRDFEDIVCFLKNLKAKQLPAP